MRTKEDLRQRWIARAEDLIAGRAMSTRTGFAMELLLGTMLRDMCFLDDRDEDYQKISRELDDRYGQFGIAGLFKSLFDRERCQSEVAAVYAEVFARLGYIRPSPVLSRDHWAEVALGLPAMFDDHDMRLSEVERKLGPPSGRVDDRVLCYASSRSADGWIIVEGHDVVTRSYDVEAGRYQVTFDRDPLVRSVRRSAADFEEGLVLTPYGKLLRWGESWWIHHASRPVSDCMGGTPL